MHVSFTSQVNGDGADCERGRTRSILGTTQPIWTKPAEVFIVTSVEDVILEVNWRMGCRAFLPRICRYIRCVHFRSNNIQFATHTIYMIVWQNPPPKTARKRSGVRRDSALCCSRKSFVGTARSSFCPAVRVKLREEVNTDRSVANQHCSVCMRHSFVCPLAVDHDPCE